MQKHTRHLPALAKEAIEFLGPKPNQNFIDCTIGDGGHAEVILDKTAPRGKLVGFDRDEQALNRARKFLSKFGERIQLINDNFANLDKYVDTASKPDGILFDFGFSSAEIQDPERGFSFHASGPLDMRFDRRQELTAAHIVNMYVEKDLVRIFRQYGEERYALKIARQIVQTRKKSPIAMTQELVRVIGQAVPASYLRSRIHFATRVFQALRVETNAELEAIEAALPKALAALKPGGTIVAISFHSLEDRIVKHLFKDWAKQDLVKILTKKPIRPSEPEIENNPRARSAKLRAIQKQK
ncbi:16S rRNA (cytosine(1402)-N(4))-methyltransferase RsmH [Patescibacteria group bacterium]|nr:16S rRNA (cytosine(1402)-N(4))-methyltransferase RsmH [Patescibacteria group bacterium]MBU1922562.1 16S rRNA (cytosine(1402)-N(4))-methyltransferase RsmH [Patescibacteria group bacterium]